ncbi:hypothetical protein [Methylobacterium sp. WSM2598]|uniref:hypothetical protein n=1 Tax=Methylobacterium sp. WSM2598 TaxID=398261 RepID=UPI00038003D8|nr:hypothetical protein [Methylobacterium sp. WSM2598]
MHDLDVRGSRFDLVQARATAPEMLEPLSGRADELGWYCQIDMWGDEIVTAADTFLQIRGKLVFDGQATYCRGAARVERTWL